MNSVLLILLAAAALIIAGVAFMAFKRKAKSAEAPQDIYPVF